MPTYLGTQLSRKKWDSLGPGLNHLMEEGLKSYNLGKMEVRKFHFRYLILFSASIVKKS